MTNPKQKFSNKLIFLIIIFSLGIFSVLGDFAQATKEEDREDRKELTFFSLYSSPRDRNLNQKKWYRLKIVNIGEKMLRIGNVNLNLNDRFLKKFEIGRNLPSNESLTRIFSVVLFFRDSLEIFKDEWRLSNNAWEGNSI